MKRQKKKILCLIMVLIIALIGCGKSESVSESKSESVSESKSESESANKSESESESEIKSESEDFSLGSWNGYVFENSWLNMKFEVPEDWKIATQEEMSTILGAGAEAIDIKGTSTEQLKAALKMKTSHSFMASNQSGTTNAILSYENLAMTIGGTKYTEMDYLDSVLKILLQQENLEYEFIENSSTEIANKTFETMTLSLYGGALYQEYYCYKKDEFMVTLILTYAPGEEDLKVDFINNISTLE
jgi:hypothetical protein